MPTTSFESSHWIAVTERFCWRLLLAEDDLQGLKPTMAAAPVQFLLPRSLHGARRFQYENDRGVVHVWLALGNGESFTAQQLLALLPTPPPPAQPPAANSLDTPSHQRLASYAQYSSNSGPYQQAAYVQAASELENKFISTCAARFVEFHFRTDPDTGSPPQVDYDALSRISQYKNEIKMYDPLVCH
jgi:hypothetical protein